jgi:hypothetical protein
MQQMLEYPVKPLETIPLTVKRCILAMSHEADKAEAEGISPWERKKRAQVAYKLYMPAMEDRDSIRAYIACVAHGISLKVFNGRDASQMLYAAQVAMSLVKEPKANGRPRLAARRGRCRA